MGTTKLEMIPVDTFYDYNDDFFFNDLERRESLARGCVSLVGPESVHDSTLCTPALSAPRVFAVCPSYVRPVAADHHT